MRLNSIKLSGFKSFADPTHFHLPGQLVGVVGPNGCGKSNIMDAVRWVLGESKASELRGESMQDVIFNGSGHRKPASRASVELIFSNEDARAGGQWNQFAEIAVKRVLARDGNSGYYINGQSVRRRDVHDVFLGTGLGPRAYAIIGQGTISRIIESKPEELRLFLEEAAGVSKYKERRRELLARDTADDAEFFVRPAADLKEFTGGVMPFGALRVWGDGLAGTVGPLSLDTRVQLATPKNVSREWRTILVGGRVVAASRYRTAGRLDPSAALITGDRIPSFLSARPLGRASYRVSSGFCRPR
jgi:energy-coupling factor transporter ATP-binding protein EcfA2